MVTSPLIELLSADDEGSWRRCDPAASLPSCTPPSLQCAGTATTSPAIREHAEAQDPDHADVPGGNGAHCQLPAAALFRLADGDVTTRWRSISAPPPEHLLEQAERLSDPAELPELMAAGGSGLLRFARLWASSGQSGLEAITPCLSPP